MLKHTVKNSSLSVSLGTVVSDDKIERYTEIEFIAFRMQIKKRVETAKQPRADKTSKLKKSVLETESTPSLSQNLYYNLTKLKPASRPPDVAQRSLGELLTYVADGEQDKAEELIRKDRNLLLHIGTVNDLSGREFKLITAFQYALWAMDWHMWTMIQKYLPQEAQANSCKH